MAAQHPQHPFDLAALRAPIIQAPMAAGPSTPALAAAVADAGGVGFLAAGYRSAAQLAEEIAATRALTDRPFGVNCFVPQPSVADPDALAAYARVLADEAAAFGATLGTTHADDDDWAAKLDVLIETAPPLASFTFGAPDADQVARLKRAGVLVLVTVTTAAERDVALAAGADALVLQGPDGGGHRGTFDPSAEPAAQPLEDLLAETRAATDVPLVAAGGVTTASQVQALLELGAVAVQVGTMFLRVDEAGTRATHADALADPQFTETSITHAFSGRPARGLLNDFMRAHDAHAPLGYPEVNQLTGPLRTAAGAAGDPHHISLWAGTGFRDAPTGPAADVVRLLTP